MQWVVHYLDQISLFWFTFMNFLVLDLVKILKLKALYVGIKKNPMHVKYPNLQAQCFIIHLD